MSTDSTASTGTTAGERAGTLDVIGAVARSVGRTAGLLARRRLAMPTRWRGVRLDFADGTSSSVFLETVLADAVPAEPAVLVVKFRLRWIGSTRWAHAVFRRSCVVNTPLFAGFPGFVSKLWLTDQATGEYRGFYAWDGASRAEWYARRLSRVLALVAIRGSVGYHVIDGVTREHALERYFPPADATSWWLPIEVEPAR